MIIQDNTIFIADAHYNRERLQLKKIFLMLQNETLCCKQIFLMGDIFDFLSSEIDYFKTINNDIVVLVNKLSITHEIIYLEGNHDYNLQNLFPKVVVIPREKQPLFIYQENKQIALAHGDIFTPTLYNIYTAIIRNHYFMQFINIIDIKQSISQYIENSLINKSICHEQSNFKEFVKQRKSDYNHLKKVDLIIEGHYHQGYKDEGYINLPSLACDNRYMIYKNHQFSFNTV